MLLFLILIGMLSRSYTLNSNTSRDYDSLKQQCDMAMSELTLLKRQHSETTRRCDHAMKVSVWSGVISSLPFRFHRKIVVFIVVVLYLVSIWVYSF